MSNAANGRKNERTTWSRQSHWKDVEKIRNDETKTLAHRFRKTTNRKRKVTRTTSTPGDGKRSTELGENVHGTRTRTSSAPVKAAVAVKAAMAMKTAAVAGRCVPNSCSIDRARAHQSSDRPTDRPAATRDDPRRATVATTTTTTTTSRRRPERRDGPSPSHTGQTESLDSRGIITGTRFKGTSRARGPGANFRGREKLRLGNQYF